MKTPPPVSTHIKVPLQSTTKTGGLVFAYMRRSTKKAEQADSLLQQIEGVNYIAEKLGIDIQKISYFIESKSGFENKRRKEWDRMIAEIDQQSEPCILLCRDISRLSRNPTHNLVIADRLCCDNDFRKKQKIGKIYFLEGDLVIKEWNNRTSKAEVAGALHKNYMDSLSTKDKSGTGHKLKLQAKELPYATPHGITRSIVSTGERYQKNLHKGQQTILKQNEEMPFIRRAFEMKVEGKPTKEISSYLRRYGKINIPSKKISEAILSNTVYRGVYTDKRTHEEHALNFYEGKPPITQELWSKANYTLRRKGSGYGLQQKYHIAKGKIKTENGDPFHTYLAKKKYRAYKTGINLADGKIKNIHIMESKIITGFIKKIWELFMYFQEEKIKEIVGYQDAENTMIKKFEDTLFTDSQDPVIRASAKTMKEIYLEMEALQGTEEMKEMELRMLNETNTEEERARFLVYGHLSNRYALQESKKPFYEGLLHPKKLMFSSIVQMRTLFKKSPLVDSLRGDIEIKARNVGELGEQKKKLEKQLSEYRTKAVLANFPTDEISKVSKEMEHQVQEVQDEIDSFSNDGDIEQYLEQLPEIINKISELSSNACQQKDFEEMRESVKKLMELTTSELFINDKKELKIKLFGVLDMLLNDGKGPMEPPSGFEPETSALPWLRSTN